MENHIIPIENVWIKEEVIDSDALSLDGNDTIRDRITYDGNTLKYIDKGKDVMNCETLNVTITKSNDRNNLLTAVNHMEETSPYEPNSNKTLFNTRVMTGAIEKEENSFQRASMEAHINSSSSTWIEKEVMDDPLAVSDNNDILIKQEPQQDEQLLEEGTDESTNFMDCGNAIKYETLDVTRNESADEDVLLNDTSNAGEIPWDQNITKEELIISNTKIIKVEEQTRIADFMGEASGGSDFLKTIQICCDRVPEASYLTSYVCAQCQTSFLHGVMIQNEDKSLICKECHKRKLETLNQVRREMPYVCNGTDSVDRNDIQGMNAWFPQREQPTSENLAIGEKHSQLHPNDKKFVCTVCKKGFRSRSALTDHFRVHTGEKPFECTECNKVFSLKSHLNKHVLVHTGEKPFKCPMCSKAFSQTSNLNSHILVHTGERPFECPMCNKVFPSTSNLNRHLSVHTGEKPFQCNECDKAFTQQSKLNVHLMVHRGEKPYKCNECNKVFTKKANLNAHLKVHSGEKAYECNECRKVFKRKAYLMDHLPVHTGEKPFACAECDMVFSARRQLRNHLLVHTGEKPFECPECNKTFADKGSGRRHVLLHTGEKPFECVDCNKVFALKSSLNAHLKIHSGEKPFKCSVCNKGFVGKSDLKKHLQIHTGIKPYKCNKCNKMLARKWNLNHHILRCHTRE